MSPLILLASFIILGRVIYGKGENSWTFLKVFFSFVFYLLGNFIVMAGILVLLAAGLFVLSEFVPEDSGVFSFTNGDVRIFMAALFFFIVISAVCSYFIRRPILKRFPKLQASEEQHEICEYFIQWSTIYLAVYQFIFDGLNKAFSTLAGSDSVFHAVSFIFLPGNLNLLLQPLLIASWIVVVIEKYRNRHVTSNQAQAK